MSRAPFRYVQSFTDRHGHVRHYFRRGAFRVPLPSILGSASFVRAYEAALAGAPLPASRKARARKQVEIAANGAPPPKMGVYLLVLKGELVYVGSSLDMPTRVAEHRSNGRPFDQVFFIPTKLTERLALEKILIRALRPTQNRTNGTGREQRVATRRGAGDNPQ